MSLSLVPIRLSRDIQLFQTVKDVRTLNPLVDLLESIEFLLKHLYIYTEIRPTTAITQFVMKILVELLSILALATNLLKRGRPGAFLFADVLPDSMQRRAIYKETLWWEVRSDNGGKAGWAHAGRGSDDCTADSRGRPWSCPAYEGGHDR